MIRKAITHPFFLLLLLLILTVSSLMQPGYFPMHDDMQAMRLLQMDKCIKDNQIPCRWVPDMGYGYGYPQFNYYAPLPYYIMEVFHLGGLGFLDSVKAGFILSVIISAYGMYIFGTSLWGKAGGFVSSLLYIYAPYRAVDMYVRGAVGEFYALAILPFIFFSAREVFKNSKYATLWLSLSLSALFLSHNVTTLLFAPFFALWIIFLWLVSKKSIQSLLKDGTIKRFIISCFWSVGIASFFLLPAYFEKSLVHVETLTQGYFNYLAHFVSIKQMLFSHFWGYGSSELGSHEELSFLVGIIHWVLPFVVLSVALFTKQLKKLAPVLFFIIIAWVGLFMTHQKSVFVWNVIPVLSYVQFPWRFLTIATFAFSVAGGAVGLFIAKRSKWRTVTVSMITIALVLLYGSFFRPQQWLNLTDSEKFSGELWEKQLTISIFDYLPKSAKFPPSEKASEMPIASEGEISITDGEKGTNWQRWQLTVLTETSTFMFPIYSFPNWKVENQNGEVEVKSSGNLGLLTVTLPQGEHTLSAKLFDTPVRQYSNIISLVSILAIPLYLKKKTT